MPRNQYFKSGDWNAVCDFCGFKFKASELKLDWRGFRVCEEDFELRHPLDFLRAKPDKIKVPWTRPDVGIEIPSPVPPPVVPPTPSTLEPLGGHALGLRTLGS